MSKCLHWIILKTALNVSYYRCVDPNKGKWNPKSLQQPDVWSAGYETIVNCDPYCTAGTHQRKDSVIFCPLLIKQKSNSVILILFLICLQNAHIRLFKISFKTVIILQPARNLVIVRVGTVLPDGASQKGDCRHCWRSWSRDPHVITAFSVGPSAFPLSKHFHSLLHWIWQQPGTAQQGLNHSNFSSSEENQQKQIPNVSTVLANSNLYLLLWIPCYHVFLPILTNIWKQNHRL